MPITEKQRLERRNHIGGSDLPAIMGYSRFSSAWDVWAEKCGMLEDRKETPDMLLGTHLEIGVLNRAEVDLGRISPRNAERVVKGTRIKVHVDGIRRSNGEPVECKTTNSFRTGETWGEVGTDDVPEYTLCQTHGHMLATGKGRCWVPTLLNGDYCLYVVDFNKQLAQNILEAAEAFWKCVETRTPPKSLPSLETVKRLKRQPKKMVNLDEQMVQALVKAREAATAAEKAKKTATARVLAALGDAEAGLTESSGAFTYYTEHRSGYSVTAKDIRILRYKKKGL